MTTKITIEILDSIECRIPKDQYILVHQFLSHDAVYWKQGPYKKTRKQYRKSVLTFNGKKWCRFYTGLLPSLKKWCKEQGIQVEIIGEEFKITPSKEPHLEGITFREDQLELIGSACTNNRGLLVAPTGSGKTLVFLGIMSCYPKVNILILSHTTAITQQTVDELKRFDFKSVELFGGGNKIQKPTKRITVSTIQSFIKLQKEDYMDYYDMVIVDEVHRVGKQKSTYSDVLGNLLAPLRFGFTATPLKDPEAQLTYGGLLGPIIGRLTVQKAAELNILAKPKLKLIKAEYSLSLMDVRKYQDAYTQGITENTLRNVQIANIAYDFYKKKETTLIFVTHIEHGITLQNLIAEKLNRKIPFIQGNTPLDQRSVIKKGLLEKKITVCIATISWMEGLNIPNLSCLILAGGGRSETQLIQKIGRVLRRTKDKDVATIVDFLDLGNRHLILHTGERIGTYSDLDFL